VWTAQAGLNTISFIQNIHMPSLEHLTLGLVWAGFNAVHLLCCKVSSTLTTLELYYIPNTFDLDELRRLLRIPFPKLRTL
jgi:hypothetical protein